MQDNQKDLIRESLEKKLQYIDECESKIKGYNEFKQWVKNAIIEHVKPKMIMLGTSKQSLLTNFKDQINFPQKDFLEIVKCMECYTPIYDEKFRSISVPSRAYYMDEEHPKFKKFMLSVGLLDAFTKGYIFTGPSCYNIGGFINPSNIRSQNSVRSIFDIYTNLKTTTIDNVTNIAELVHSEYYTNSVIEEYEYMEKYGIDKIKERILEVLESEKSK